LFQPQPRVPELDGIRGIAILLVVLLHYFWEATAPGTPPAFILDMLGIGWTGVDLFFVLSGFLIGGILIDNRDSSGYFSAFYARRACRIFPLYYVWLPLAFLATLWIPSAPALPGWAYVTYTQNFYVAATGLMGPHWLAITWSLAVEEQFYLFLPPLIRYTPARLLPWAVAAFAVAAPALRALLLRDGVTALPIYVLMPCRMDALLAGVLCALLVRTGWPRRHARLLYAPFLALLAGAFWLDLKSPVPSSEPEIYFGYTLMAALYSTFLLIAVSEKRGPLAALTRLAPLRRLGVLAYGVYLLHDLVNRSLHRLFSGREPRAEDAAGLAVTLLSFALTVAAAHVSWEYFEKKVVAYGHGFKYGRSKGKR
jgi:peptidoglycan/LPS O-acetylase OafA/YrhL